MAPGIKIKVQSFLSRLLTGAAGVVHAITSRNKKVEDYPWQSPSAEDRRSPCPMLNALANHGYLPRDGKDISVPRLVTALLDAINLAPDATIPAGLKALQTSTTGNALTFHLDDLAKHGIIEHDGSLSRHDIHAPPPNNNNNKDFAPEVWATVLPQLGPDGDRDDDGTISIDTAAKARLAHIAAVKALEPEFSMSADDIKASVIETCLYLLVFGEGAEGRARREWVRILFEQERLPFEEGFKRSKKTLTSADIQMLEEKVNAASQEQADTTVANLKRERKPMAA
ncbi:Cloroperoxidase [Parathielavia appendiculata]|uniref:Cloroperoxidase n=1 Tax=Parathielavia appendiculata TaxID=2587402 RepID=A0AAN6Z281_9PEZI|nr:Cloroperoxidase [Parathielavia appendiculata]